MDSTLSKYLRNAIKSGKTKQQIQQEVDDGFEQLNTQLMNASKSFGNINIELKNLTASQILLAIGSLITVLGGIIYITINWQQWNFLARIFAILLPMLAVYIAGILMWLSKTYQKQAIAFIITGALLFPLFLVITFKELHILENAAPGAFGFTVSLLSLILYLAQSLYFNSPIWAFISPAAGLFVYYFGLDLLGVEKVFNGVSRAWAFLIPASAYLVLGAYYTKKNLVDRDKYPFMLGAIVAIFSVVSLLANSLSKEETAWLLFLPSFVYFLAATFLEKMAQKANSRILYFISLFAIFLILVRLSITGDLLNFIVNFKPVNELIIGGSILVSGLIYLFLDWGLNYLRKFGYEGAARFSEFFEAVGTLATLGGIFYMSTGGKKIFHETLVLLTSIGFIFGSIPKQSRPFLYIGTLFLIVYIFDIGNEYFQNQVGWPITLFVAGIISMGIGFGIEKVKRKYFTGLKQ